MMSSEQFSGFYEEPRQQSSGPSGLPGQSDAAAFGHSPPIPPPENFQYPEDTDNDSPLFATDEFRVWYDPAMQLFVQIIPLFSLANF